MIPKSLNAAVLDFGLLEMLGVLRSHLKERKN